MYFHPNIQRRAEMQTIISAVFLMVIGGVGLYALLSALRKRKQFQSWDKIQGRVIERGVFQPNNAGRLSSPAFRYSPLVKYVYTVNEKEYVGENLFHPQIQLPQTSSEAWARKKADSFPDEVTVNYNPANPADSFLVTSSKVLFISFSVVCALLFLIGALILLSRAI